MDILFVTPDYYSERPKPCMNGWGRQFYDRESLRRRFALPNGFSHHGLRFDNVRTRSLGWIWGQSESFNRFRGTEWMPLPCRDCSFREIDFGGCRCQAALIAGDANVTDPACSLSPYREKLTRFVESIQPARPAFTSADVDFVNLAFRSAPTA